MEMEKAGRGSLLTVKQAADYLGISVYTMRNWLSQRRLTFLKVGRCTRLEQTDLEEFAQKNKVKARAS